MPYIKKERRDEFHYDFRAPYDFDGHAEETPETPKNAGELNYLITLLCKGYLFEHGLSYANINSVMGALECAKLEFYRRIVVPYEDKKIKENGDVYTV